MVTKLWHWFVKRWWLVYLLGIAGIIAFTAVMPRIPPRPDYQAETINYVPVYLDVDLLMGILAFCPALLLILACILYGLKSRYQAGTALLVVITLVGYVFWLALIGPMVGRIYINPRLTHLADVEGPAGPHYALATYDYPMYPGTVGGYNLYSCENFPSECHLIFTRGLNMYESYRKESLNDPAFQPRLEADQTGAKFYLGDELLYTAP